jgi:hypothetical protein
MYAMAIYFEMIHTCHPWLPPRLIWRYSVCVFKGTLLNDIKTSEC